LGLKPLSPVQCSAHGVISITLQIRQIRSITEIVCTPTTAMAFPTRRLLHPVSPPPKRGRVSALRTWGSDTDRSHHPGVSYDHIGCRCTCRPSAPPSGGTHDLTRNMGIAPFFPSVLLGRHAWHADNSRLSKWLRCRNIWSLRSTVATRKWPDWVSREHVLATTLYLLPLRGTKSDRLAGIVGGLFSPAAGAGDLTCRCYTKSIPESES
jgi:hypothetical protein